MNIQQAKDQVKQSVSAYLTKNEFNEYKIPVSAQRPVFIMGAPGIGKTDIMRQVAEELSIGLVSYSMTHHTRQSALGLPFIVDKDFNGEKYAVSEYTMSEILSTVYDLINDTGIKEGILFLDEINCVSETLAPSMLQFLQFKTFGRHKVPDGWVIVTAGNPGEYNNSTRDFDVATWDRLKRIDVEPDLNTWLKHAKQIGVHPAITSYLEVKQKDFYSVESTVDGQIFVTARGWVDLSQMMRLYEEKNFRVDEILIKQYIQHKNVAHSFAIYYDLFQKYRSDYKVESILNATYTDEVLNRAKKAKFDEALALLSLLLESVIPKVYKHIQEEKSAMRFAKEAVQYKTVASIEKLKERVGEYKTILDKESRAGIRSGEEIHTQKCILKYFYEMIDEFENNKVKFDIMTYAKNFYDKYKKKSPAKVAGCKEAIENVITFCHKAFGDEQSFFLLMTQLTTNRYTAEFLSRHGEGIYHLHNQSLLVFDKRNEIVDEIKELLGES